MIMLFTRLRPRVLRVLLQVTQHNRRSGALRQVGVYQVPPLDGQGLNTGEGVHSLKMMWVGQPQPWDNPSLPSLPRYLNQRDRQLPRCPDLPPAEPIPALQPQAAHALGAFAHDEPAHTEEPPPEPLSCPWRLLGAKAASREVRSGSDLGAESKRGRASALAPGQQLPALPSRLPGATRLDQWELAQQVEAVRVLKTRRAGGRLRARASTPTLPAREAGARYPRAPSACLISPALTARATSPGPDGPRNPGPGAGSALLHLGRGGTALRARKGAVAGDRAEGVQHQRVHSPSPWWLPGYQPLRRTGCYGERRLRWIWEEAGPGYIGWSLSARDRKFGAHGHTLTDSGESWRRRSIPVAK